jgi:hypothetical protein
MMVRWVSFGLAGLSVSAYEQVAERAAPAFAAWPGLVSKVWWVDEEAGRAGGMYVFASKEAADASRRTALYGDMVANPAFVDVDVVEYEVLGGPTLTTGGPLRSAAGVAS